ncbi:MAG TPA: Clp protease N-terminal domain-containing protein [Actinomycetospora sp.]|uniref:Clp protease N-terminal domain-containing protein n=1 Tax=Actinomycetospora sp. TaxID=1872135 RepID=UPI002F4096F0
MVSERTGTGPWPGLAAAREHAAAQGARSVGTQHVLLALLRREAVEAAPLLERAGADHAAVTAALQGITGVGARPVPIPIERISLSPRVGALLRRASGDTRTTPDDLAVLDQLLDDGGEPSLAHLVLTSLGARRRALAARRDGGTVATMQVGREDGDLVPG